MIEIEIKKNDAGQRLDKFLVKTFRNLPPSLMYKGIRQKKIKLNRRRAEERTILNEGDLLQIFLPPEFFSQEAAKDSFLHLEPRLELLYEDAHILVCEKKPGMSVHADEQQESGTLIDHIKAYLYQKGEYDPQNEQSFAPALCNRIDRNTGGIVLAAKDAESLRILNEQIKEGGLDKRYLCAAHGVFEKKSDLLTGWLIKDGASNSVRVFDAPPKEPGAKEIRTAYQVLAQKEDLSLVEVRLLTGRTHQIRAHLAHIGHPLFGDEKYGKGRQDRKNGGYFQALCAYKLTFVFAADAGPLNYLRGKTVCVPLSHIGFLRLFPDFPPLLRDQQD